MTDLTLKLLLIGNSNTGKSSLLLRFIEDSFAAEDSQATIGVDFKVKVLTAKNGQKVKLAIWDTAGQERFRTLTSSYYRGCQGVLLVFDVCNRETFDMLPKWFTELDSFTQKQDVVKFVVGNKIDKSARVVSKDEAVALAEQYQAQYFEASAKTGVGSSAIFSSLTEVILSKLETGSYAIERRLPSIELTSPQASANQCNC